MSAPKGHRGKQRGHSEGALYYSEAKGLWVGYPAREQGQSRAKPVYGKTRVKTLDKLKKAQDKIDEGRPVESAHDTVENLLTDFFAYGLPSSKVRSANTVATIRWVINEHLVPALGTIPLRDLSADDVDTMLVARAGEGLSSSSLKRIHGTLKRALRWGERRDRVSRNVAELVDTPAGTTRESKALSIEQGKALLAKVHHHRLEALFLMGLTIPTRPGELLGLCWDCVDFDTGVVHFYRALHRNSTTGELWLDELKTPESRRAVEAPSTVMEALRRWKATQAAERLRAGHAWHNEWNLAFTTEAGAPVEPANLRRSLRRLAKAAGIGETWTVRELRHSAVSALSDQGVSIEDIANAAGHKNSRVTQVVYRKNLSPTVRSVKTPMEGIYGAAETTTGTEEDAEATG